MWAADAQARPAATKPELGRYPTMLVTLLIVILVLGLLLYLVQLLPLAQPFKTAAMVVVVVIGVIYLLGLLPGHHGLVL